MVISADNNNATDGNHGRIHCITPNGCDQLYITTNSEWTQLIMYEFSDNVVWIIILDIYLKMRILCIDRYIKYRTWINETEATISESIKNEYQDSNNYPCESVVKCGNYSCD